VTSTDGMALMLASDPRTLDGSFKPLLLDLARLSVARFASAVVGYHHLMVTTRAKVVDGSLVLDEKLPLPNDTRVVVSIQPAGWQDRLRRGLVAIRSRDVSSLIHSDGKRFARDTLHDRA